MKRILTTLFISVAIAIALPMTSFAASTGTEEISGVITNNGNIAIGAQVIVVCNNNTKRTKTDNTGTYLVQYKITQCPNEARANVTATYNGHSGSNSGSVKNKNLTDNLDVATVPGLGLVTGATATVLGGVGYITIRSREISGYKI